MLRLYRAAQQSDAAYQSGQAAFGNGGNSGGGFAITPMMLLLIGGLAFLALKK